MTQLYMKVVSGTPAYPRTMARSAVSECGEVVLIFRVGILFSTPHRSIVTQPVALGSSARELAFITWRIPAYWTGWKEGSSARGFWPFNGADINKTTDIGTYILSYYVWDGTVLQSSCMQGSPTVAAKPDSTHQAR